ncbi:MAG TPA: translocation/assembly module TamB domain-containing protein, partial [Vicinamibacterales bacterium]
PVDRPSLAGTLTLSEGLLGDGTHPPLQDIALGVELADDVLHIRQGEAHWQGAHLEVTGTVPAWFARLPGASRNVPPASLSGHIDDVTLKVLEPFVPAEALQATSFDSRVEFTVAAAEPSLDAVTGEVLLQRAVIKSRELGLAQRRPARLRLAQGVITLEPWTIGAPWSVATAVTLQGSVRLPDGERPGDLNVTADGHLDLRAVGLLFGTYRPDGRAVFDLRVEGPVTAPEVVGVVQVENAGFATAQPRLVLSELSGGIRFQDDRLIVDGITGSLNGGTVDITGDMRQPWRGQADGALAITAGGVLVDFRGLRSALDADLTFEERQAPGRFALGGTITVAQASYRETLLLTGGLVSLLSPRQDALIVADEGSGGPRWLGLDLRVLAEDTIGVDTTYGEFVASANLRVAGTAANPRLAGTIDIAPGGQLFFGGRRYQVEEGRVEFRGASFLRPQVRLLAHTTIGGYEVTLNVQSEGDVIDTTLSSDPPLPEADIASLMLSGQRRPTGDPGEVVTEQLLAALSGEIVGAVGRAIGFDSVRIEQANPGDLLIDPTLISSDSNPAQRVTFSKRVFPDLEVIVSQSLRESGDVTWVVSWTPLRSLELRVVQLDDNDRSYEVRHDLTFGEGVRSQRRTRTRRDLVQSLEVEVRGPVSEADVRRQLRIEQGNRVDFYEWQRARDRVEDWLFQQGFYEARVTTRHEPLAGAREGAPTPVALRYLVETGPPTALRVTGFDVPAPLLDTMRRTWAEIAVDGLLQDAFTDVLRPWLAGNGYLLPEVSLVFSVVQGVKTATVYVDAGPRFPDRALDIRGNEGVSRSTIVSAVEQAGLRDTMWARPGRLQALLLALYRRNGYLAAEVDVLDPVFDGGTARLPV